MAEKEKQEGSETNQGSSSDSNSDSTSEQGGEPPKVRPNYRTLSRESEKDKSTNKKK